MMFQPKPPPIHEILRRIQPLAPHHKAAYLSSVIAAEPRRSLRRVELESALKEIISKQLRKEARAS